MEGDDREKLVRETFEKLREAGYPRFREEFFTDHEAVETYPDPVERDQKLREHWNEFSEENYPAHRERMSSMTIGEIARYSANLLAARALVDGDAFGFEGEMASVTPKQESIDPDPIPTPAEIRAIMAEMMEDTALRKMPEDPTSPKTYDQQLQDAIDSGRFRQRDKERSR